jgi:hypothetical protein
MPVIKDYVKLRNKWLFHIPSFLRRVDEVSGNFDCSDNQLKTLVGSPRTVGGHFDCTANPLKSSLGAPHTVGGNFYFGGNLVKFTQVGIRVSKIGTKYYGYTQM